MDDINKELEALFDDPLLNIKQEDLKLFELSEPLKKQKEEKREEADYVAKRKRCEDFHLYEEGFRQVQRDLRSGKRMLRKFTAKALKENGYYVLDGMLVYVERIFDKKQVKNKLLSYDGRTRTIYENGTESDITLQTLTRAAYSDGYMVTENSETDEHAFQNQFSQINEKDVADGYIYVLSSLSEEPEIKCRSNLYKIGFSTTPVEERIRNCEYEPTYLMDKVRIVATWKTYNLKTHVLEDLLHKFFSAVQFRFKVIDLAGNEVQPREWYEVPLPIIEKVVEKIIDGSIVNYRYNPQLQVLEEVKQKRRTTTKAIDTTGWAILSLRIKSVYFNQILKGEKDTEYRKIKDSTLNRYTWVEAETGNRYLKKFDALKLNVCDSTEHRGDYMLVEVVDTTFISEENTVAYKLGKILQVDMKE